MTAFLKEIQIPGRKLEDIVQVFKKFSEQVKVERAEPGGWAVSFENPEIDPYIYYIEEDDFGLVYHRFTKEAYGALKEH